MAKMEKAQNEAKMKQGKGRPREFDRNQALQKAMQVFWTYGYEGASLSELKKAMKLSAPSLYAAFGSKEMLFKEAVELYLSDSTTSRALNEQATAKDAIHTILRDAALSFTSQKNPPGCLVVLGTMNCTPASRPVQKHLRDIRLETPKKIRKRLEAGVLMGDVPASTNLNAIASFYTTVLHGLSIQARDGATRKELLDVVDNAMLAWDTFWVQDQF